MRNLLLTLATIATIAIMALAYMGDGMAECQDHDNSFATCADALY